MTMKGKSIGDEFWVNLVDDFQLKRGSIYLLSNNGPRSLYLTEQALDPTSDDFFIIIRPGESINLNILPLLDFWCKSESTSTTIISIEQIGGAFRENPMFRWLSATGLPPVGAPSAADIKITGVGSLASPIDYYVEALEGERFYVSRFIINIRSSGNVSAGKYGDLDELTNGLQIFYRKDGVLVDVLSKVTIKTNEDWGKIAYDDRPFIYPSGQTPFIQARLSLSKFVDKKGLLLDEGDRIGVRVRDSLSGLNDHTVHCQGRHVGIQNPAWTVLL